MSNDTADHKKYAVEKYLEQVKVLTALATTLLLSPNLIVALKKPTESGALAILELKPQLKGVLLTANIAFLVSILLTYLIYSSIVGSAHAGEYNVDRPATRLFSLLQFFANIDSEGA